MRACRWFVGAGLPLALFLVLFGASRGVAEEDAFAGVRKQCSAIVAAWNAHDAKAMAAAFAEDGDMIDPSGKHAEGRAAVEKAFAEMHGPKGPMRESTLEVKDEPVRFVTADVAVSDATVVVTGAKGPKGEASGPMTLVITNVWKRANGVWWLFASRASLKHVEASPG